ncbi:MAG: anthranilate synthase component I family protein [Chitinophagaceae bacterium]|nr:anthranilate synthase component I family protein [Chitinophagaceae bacterium]
MKKIEILTTYKKLLADVYTPVGIYLRLRDRFRDTILMESSDFHAGENSYSFIAINPIAGIEIRNTEEIEYKLPLKKPEKIKLGKQNKIAGELWDFMQRFQIKDAAPKPVNIAQGLFGYSTYDAIQFFDSIELNASKASPNGGELVPINRDLEGAIPLMRYRLFQYVIAINHFKDELFICENHINGLESGIDAIETLIKSKDVPDYPFKANGIETSGSTDAGYIDMVKKGIASCLRGDVFQIVLSRNFQQSFKGDEFKVYRALRSINPSPYLFYFDFGDYKLMGSSPESQLIIQNNKAIVHPIAGTFKRTGDDITDQQLAEKLLVDEKENAEHVMLVDLARNDLSRLCDNVTVTQFAKIQYYSHVIHLVSEVTGTVRRDGNPFELLAATFPAGTLSGAPKFRAMQLIDSYEDSARSYYGGCIGFMGFDGSCNQAIMIRTFLSKDNTLNYRAGAGIVAVSQPESELQEVNNKLNALKNAIALAENI